MATHEVTVPLRWSDMDALQHINNVAVMRLLEEARIRFLTGHLSQSGDAKVTMFVAHQEIDYLTPLLYSPEPVRIVLSVTRIGRSGFDLGYEVIDDDGAVAAIAETSMVVVDGAGRPTPLPAELRTELGALVGDPVPFRRRRVSV
ncbi:acyl-CoA thioesterase [Tsukamurella asaccharolytica]|uniref:Acyl-CoA thioesterase n=1 Tax=Tsukamurella asaccharolytica TaxID=2592067 RepID=A0A5C5R6T9_9ACTN|nr:acyl-CoA thioesterase [Tsukamurella asaccharolytica]TWS18382.1 acyl-CoA thioesterase [Tsukamurella asaccharolytica]